MDSEQCILIVGEADSEAAQELSEAGYCIKTLSTVTEAADAVASGDYHLVILDPKALTSADKKALTDLDQAYTTAHRESVRHEAEAQSTLQTVVNTVPIGLMVADAETEEITYFSPGAEAILLGKATGKAGAPEPGSYQVLHADGRPFAPQEMPLIRSIHGEATSDVEMLIRRKDGSEVTVLVNSAPVIDPYGHITGAVSSMTDITNRKLIETELRKSQQQLSETRAEAERKAAELESVLSSIADGVTVFDREGHITFMNDAGRIIIGEIPGRSLTEWVARYQFEEMDGSPIPIEKTASYRALNGEIVRDKRFTMIGPTGKRIALSVSSAPVLDSQNNVIGAINVLRDISEQVDQERVKDEKMVRDSNIAQMLQQALIPKDVKCNVPGCSIAVRYESALKEAEVGGDFYDVFQLGKNRVGILIGDVAGKGLLAAMRIAAARYAIRSYAYLDVTPGKVLSLANEVLSVENGENLGMLTAFFAILDADSGTLICTNGGHEPAIRISASGKTDTLVIPGRALGIMGGYEYKEAVLELDPGDRIVMTTDGISEARTTSGEFFGQSGIAAYLAEHATDSADEIASGLLEAAKAHTGGNLQDDAAIIVLALEDKCREL